MRAIELASKRGISQSPSSIFNWTFANLHVKLLFGVRFCRIQSEWPRHDSAWRLQHWTHAGSYTEIIHAWRGPLEENSRIWIGQVSSFRSDCCHCVCVTL